MGGLALLIASLGCEGGERDAVDDAGAPDASASIFDAGVRSLPKSHEVSGKIVDLDGRPIAGARVCIAAHAEIPCAFSDLLGDYAMDLPVWNPTQRIAVDVSATGYLGSTLLISTSPGLEAPPLDGLFSAVWFHKIALTDVARAHELLSRQTGYRFPAPDRAFVEVDIRSVPEGQSVSAKLVAAGGEEFPPIYSVFSATWESTFDPALTSTPNGTALFAEVPPGLFEVTITGCVPHRLVTGAWVGNSPNTVAGIAVAGSLTEVAVTCRRNQEP